MIFFLALVQNFDLLSIVKHNIADMSKEKRTEDVKTATVDVRGVEPDVKTDAAIDIWIAQQKAYGRKLKKGEAVVELTKKGLRSEGVIL